MELDSEHLMPPQRCPSCGTQIDRASGEEERPKEGDLMVCIRCAELHQVGPGRLLVKADKSILAQLAPADRAKIERAQRTIRKMRRRHGLES